MLPAGLLEGQLAVADVHRDPDGAVDGAVVGAQRLDVGVVDPAAMPDLVRDRLAAQARGRVPPPNRPTPSGSGIARAGRRRRTAPAAACRHRRRRPSATSPAAPGRWSRESPGPVRGPARGVPGAAAGCRWRSGGGLSPAPGMSSRPRQTPATSSVTRSGPRRSNPLGRRARRRVAHRGEAPLARLQAARDPLATGGVGDVARPELRLQLARRRQLGLRRGRQQLQPAGIVDSYMPTSSP